MYGTEPYIKLQHKGSITKINLRPHLLLLLKQAITVGAGIPVYCFFPDAFKQNHCGSSVPKSDTVLTWVILT